MSVKAESGLRFPANRLLAERQPVAATVMWLALRPSARSGTEFRSKNRGENQIGRIYCRYSRILANK